MISASLLHFCVVIRASQRIRQQHRLKTNIDSYVCIVLLAWKGSWWILWSGGIVSKKLKEFLLGKHRVFLFQPVWFPGRFVPVTGFVMSLETTLTDNPFLSFCEKPDGLYVLCYQLRIVTNVLLSFFRVFVFFFFVVKVVVVVVLVVVEVVVKLLLVFWMPLFNNWPQCDPFANVTPWKKKRNEYFCK